MLAAKGMRFPIDVILVCIPWYAAYPLSYRQLEEMMQERGVCVDHSSINRWEIRFLPLLEHAFRKHKRPVGGSWRMDETYIKVKGVWKYLYRAVDKEGKTVDFLLTARRDKAAALRFFEKAMKANGVPEKVAMDKSGANRIRFFNSWLRLIAPDTHRDQASGNDTACRPSALAAWPPQKNVGSETCPMVDHRSVATDISAPIH